MNLTDEKVSEAIAAVMGVCWHEPSFEDDNICAKCGFSANGYDYKDKLDDYQFSAFTPDGIWRWKSYMEREMPAMWNDYLGMSHDYGSHVNLWDTEVLNNQLNSHNLVQYLFDNLDGWGYKQCPVCKGSVMVRVDSNDCYSVMCVNCSSTGKVLTEKARKFKMIWEEK
jgi:hypothetical protein